MLELSLPGVPAEEAPGGGTEPAEGPPAEAVGVEVVPPERPPRGPQVGTRAEEFVDEVQADLRSGRFPALLEAEQDPATVRAIRRAILGKANRLVGIVMDALDPPPSQDEHGKEVPGVAMSAEKRANIALKLLALGLVGTDAGDQGLMGKGQRTLRVAEATLAELKEYTRIAEAARAAGGGQNGGA